MSAFDQFFNGITAAPATPAVKQAAETQVKVAFDSPAEEAFWEGLASGDKQAARSGDDTIAAKDLFEDIFDLHTTKLASTNPEYAHVLRVLAVKEAFEAGHDETIASAQAVGIVQ